MNTVIIYSVAVLIAESYPSITATSFFYVVSDFIIAIIFGVEYLLRIISAPHRLQWFFKPLNLIDLISTLPFFIYLVAPNVVSGKTFFIFRILRLIRLLRMGAFNDTFHIAGTAFRRSGSTLIFIAYLMGLFVIFFSSAMYYAEQVTEVDGIWYRADGTKSPFQNIPATMWWCVVTITTVGYGDVVPVTWAGKVVATCTMVTGLLFVAAPVAIFGANFNEAFQEGMKRKKQIEADQSMTTITARQSLSASVSVIGEIALKSESKAQVLETFVDSQKALRAQLAELKNAFDSVVNTAREQEEALQKLREEISRH